CRESSPPSSARAWASVAARGAPPFAAVGVPDWLRCSTTTIRRPPLPETRSPSRRVATFGRRVGTVGAPRERAATSSIRGVGSWVRRRAASRAPWVWKRRFLSNPIGGARNLALSQRKEAANGVVSQSPASLLDIPLGSFRAVRVDTMDREIASPSQAYKAGRFPAGAP